jgi:hypothetical protein
MYIRLLDACYISTGRCIISQGGVEYIRTRNALGINTPSQCVISNSSPIHQSITRVNVYFSHFFMMRWRMMHINSVISTKGARFLVVDIKNFYLNTPLTRFKYVVINLSYLPQEIINEFGLLELAHYGRVYIEIQKGMYGLLQAGILVNELLQRGLALDGYRPTEHTHGLWKHKTRPVWFSLVVDDFGIKYIGHNNA